MGVVTPITKEEFLEINPDVEIMESDKFFSIRESGQAIVGTSGSVEFYNVTRELDQQEEFALMAALSPRMKLDAEDMGDTLMGSFDDEEKEERIGPALLRVVVMAIGSIIGLLLALGIVSLVV